MSKKAGYLLATSVLKNANNSFLASGLFHQAAAMSGTAIAEWSMDRDPIDTVTRLARKLNCTDISTSLAIRTCLLALPWGVISQNHFEMMVSFRKSWFQRNSKLDLF